MDNCPKVVHSSNAIKLYGIVSIVSYIVSLVALFTSSIVAWLISILYIWLTLSLLGHTDTSNNLLRVAVANVHSPVGVQLQCTFLSGFTGSTRCTVQYGTDPTYMNLPYSAESTETGTAGDSVSVVLRERLNCSTVYYYTVSAVSGDITVTVLGTFTTPQYSKCYHIVIFW